MEDDSKPQDITCSGGIKINFGAVFGDRLPPREGEDDDQ